MLDHAGPVGEVIVATPTQQKIVADFAGVEAHAGIRPEDGSNAIAAAAAAIGRMELGRLDEDTTANVGVIEGGTSGNVVPGHCGIVAETRSLDAERAAKIAGDMTEACAWGASEHGCDVDVHIEELFRGYELPKDSPALALAEAGLRSAGLEPERVAIGGGSDANALRLDGFDCVLLANGTHDVHTAERAGVGEGPRHDARGLRGDPRGRRRARRGAPVSGRLRLRRGVVVGEDPLTVEIDGERRPAWADTALLGEMREGDEVVVNVAAVELGLGSGGFDVVHVNLTRGLERRRARRGDEHVMKLNYTSIQHPVDPVEARQGADAVARRCVRMDAKGAAAPCRFWSCRCMGIWRRRPGRWRRARPGCRSATCRPGEGRCRGRSSRDVPSCASGGCSPATSPRRPPMAASTRRSRYCGALDAARRLGWDVALVGPGPGIIGSDSEFGHGGMAALDSAHAALSLGLPTMLSPRLSSADPRERHVGSATTPTRCSSCCSRRSTSPSRRAEAGDRRRPRGGAGERHRLSPRSRRPGRLPSARPAGADDGPQPRRGPALLRGPARRRARVAGAALRRKG